MHLFDSILRQLGSLGKFDPLVWGWATVEIVPVVIAVLVFVG